MTLVEPELTSGKLPSFPPSLVLFRDLLDDELRVAENLNVPCFQFFGRPQTYEDGLILSLIVGRLEAEPEDTSDFVPFRADKHKPRTCSTIVR